MLCEQVTGVLTRSQDGGRDVLVGSALRVPSGVVELCRPDVSMTDPQRYLLQRKAKREELRSIGVPEVLYGVPVDPGVLTRAVQPAADSVAPGLRWCDDPGVRAGPPLLYLAVEQN